jgi:hypothetical protein
MRYTVTLTEAELEVAALALGRMLDPKPVKERKPAGPKRYTPKPPSLPRGQFAKTEERWAKAVEAPEKWREELAYQAAIATGRHGNTDAVRRAWGIVEKTAEVAA